MNKIDKLDITFNGISHTIVYQKPNKWRLNFEKWTNLSKKIEKTQCIKNNFAHTRYIDIFFLSTTWIVIRAAKTTIYILKRYWKQHFIRKLLCLICIESRAISQIHEYLKGKTSLHSSIYNLSTPLPQMGIQSLGNLGSSSCMAKGLICT